jgi:polyisoprenoid-binding protein YceI
MIWAIDPCHLQVEFASKHLGMMMVRGHFTEVQAHRIDVRPSGR